MSKIFKRLISYVGKVKIEQLPKEWQKPVDDVLRAAEKANPNIKRAEIKYILPAKKEIIDCVDCNSQGS